MNVIVQILVVICIVEAAINIIKKVYHTRNLETFLSYLDSNNDKLRTKANRLPESWRLATLRTGAAIGLLEMGLIFYYALVGVGLL